MQVKKITRISRRDPEMAEDEYVVETDVGFIWTCDDAMSIDMFSTFLEAVGFAIWAQESQSFEEAIAGELFLFIKRSLIAQLEESGLEEKIDFTDLWESGVSWKDRDVSMLARNLKSGNIPPAIEVPTQLILDIAREEADFGHPSGELIQLRTEEFDEACMAHLNSKGMNGWRELVQHKVEVV